MKNLLLQPIGMLFLVALLSVTAPAADSQDEKTFKIADGKLQLQAPDDWKSKKPAFALIEHEFSVPPAEGDPAPGRVTVMSAGGSVDANVQRWIAQFVQTDGSDSKDHAKIKKAKAAGQDVQVVDVSGTYKESAGPFAPGPPTLRPKYRMLAAIISTKNAGNYFIKFTGPEKTVAKNEKAFNKMIEGVEVK